MEEFLKAFLVYISSAVVIAAAAGWVIRKLIDNFFSHKIEQFKAELNKEHTKYQITYEKLHTERATVIKETYQKLVDVFNAFHSLMNPMQMAGELSTEEKQKIASEAANDFVKYFDRNRIFFEEPIARRIDSFRDELWECWTAFNLSKDLRSDQNHKEGLDMWTKVWDKLNKEVPPIRKSIEKDFQRVIGIEI